MSIICKLVIDWEEEICWLYNLSCFKYVSVIVRNEDKDLEVIWDYYLDNLCGFL